MEINENAAKRRRMACIKPVKAVPDLQLNKESFQVPDYILEPNKWLVARDADARDVTERGCCAIDELTYLVFSGKLDELGDREDIKRFSADALDASLEKLQEFVEGSEKKTADAKRLMKGSKFIECLAIQRLEQLARQAEETSDTESGETHREGQEADGPLPLWVREIARLTDYTVRVPATAEAGCNTDDSLFANERLDNVGTVEGESTEPSSHGQVTVSLGLAPNLPRVGSASSSTPPVTARRGYREFAKLYIVNDEGEDSTHHMMLPVLYIGRDPQSPSSLDISKYASPEHLKRISKRQLLLVADALGIHILPLGRNSVDVSIMSEDTTHSITVDSQPLLTTERTTLTIGDVSIVLAPDKYISYYHKAVASTPL